jgi:hypothetical protein
MINEHDLEMMLSECFIEWLPNKWVNIYYMGVKVVYNRETDEIIEVYDIISEEEFEEDDDTGDLEYSCEDYSVTVVKGRYKSFSIDLAYKKHIIEVVSNYIAIDIEDHAELGFNIRYRYLLESKDGERVVNKTFNTQPSMKFLLSKRSG